MLVCLLVKGAFGVLRTAALPLTINPTNKNGAEERIGKLRPVCTRMLSLGLSTTCSPSAELHYELGSVDAVSSQSLGLGTVGVSICDVITVSVDVPVVSAQYRRFGTADAGGCAAITDSIGVSWWLGHNRES